MVIYRPATAADIPEMARVVLASFNALNTKHGFPVFPPGPPSPFYAFSIPESDASCWVAESDGTLVGMSISHKNNGLWFLTHLFVDPSSQTQGVGRALLERTLAHGGGQDATTRALITLAYNPVSTSLYIRYGMFPLDPVYTLDGATSELRGAFLDHADLSNEVIENSDAGVAALAAVDRVVLDYSRPLAHRFCLSQPTNTCHVFRDGDAAIAGYAYVSETGRIGPAAASGPLSLARVISTAVAHAIASGVERVSLTLAGCNQAVLSAAIDSGMQIRLPQVLMASGRFGDLTRYAFHPPGLL